MARILFRLTLADLRRRPLAATLTALVIAVAAATLTLSVAVGRLSDDPWQRTFDATNGGHVLVSSPDRAALEPLADLPEVSEASPVVPSSFSSFEHDGRTIGVSVFGVPPTGDVARPLVTRGRGAERGGVVLEQSFARYYDLDPGDRVSLATTTGRIALDVTGVAVTASQERYPESQPGIAFVSPATLRRIQPNDTRWFGTIALRLHDPAQSAALAAGVQRRGARMAAEDWQEQRAGATEDTRTIRIILTVFGVFLLLASSFVIANQVGARALARLREIGVLKAVGLTPRQVGAVFTAQQLVPTVAAVAIGVPVGILLSPRFLGPSQALLDTSGSPLGPLGAAALALGVLSVVALVALIPTWRAARRTTAAALGGAGASVRPSGLARRAARLGLPVPVVLGAKDAFARRGRAILTASSLVLSVVVVVAALSMEESFRREDAQSSAAIARIGEAPAPPIGPRWDFFEDQSDERAQFRLIVYGLNAVLLLMALANLLTTALLSVRERIRDFGILKTIGLTPRGVGASVMSAQGLLGLLAAVVGVPAGVAFFAGVYTLANGSTEGLAIPPWWQLLLLVPATIALVAIVCGAPARLAARIRVVDALRYE
jgi:putative ABC transport system permease protein